MQLIEYRNQLPRVERVKYLDMAIVSFFQNFRRRYLILGGGTRTFSIRDDKTARFEKLAALSCPADISEILRSIVLHIQRSLRWFPGEAAVVEQNLLLLEELVTGYYTSSSMLELDLFQRMLREHATEPFVFLTLPSCGRLQKNYYEILAKIVFKSSNADLFHAFMEPFEQLLTKLSQQNMRAEGVSAITAVLCAKLEGVCAACERSESYCTFFDWLFPGHLAVLLRLLETWWDSYEVTTSALRFFTELVHNKGQRIHFPPSSANSIILFKETSKIVQLYGSRILMGSSEPGPRDEDLYKKRLKGVSLCLEMMTFTLGGNYVCFGVFALYSDRALANALSMMYKLVLSSVSLMDLLSYSKVTSRFYNFLETLFKHHTEQVVETDQKTFTGLLSALHEGLHLTDQAAAGDASIALGHIYTFVLQQRKKKNPSKALKTLEKYMQGNLDRTSEIAASLFNSICFESTSNYWSYAKTLLAVIVFHSDAFTVYQHKLLAAQPAEHKPRLTTCLNKLMEGVQMNIENSNRELFQQRMTVFRNEVTQFCLQPT